MHQTSLYLLGCALGGLLVLAFVLADRAQHSQWLARRRVERHVGRAFLKIAARQDAEYLATRRRGDGVDVGGWICGACLHYNRDADSTNCRHCETERS